MPQVELIDPASIPSVVRQAYSEALIKAVGHLREAYHARKALVLRLAQSERADGMRSCYQRAAKRLKLQVRISGAEPRPYQKTTNQEGKEASVLYVRIVAGPQATQPAAPTSPVAAPPSRPTPDPGGQAEGRGPLEGFRFDQGRRKPGPKPKFTIPTAGADYQDLGLGIKVDR